MNRIPSLSAALLAFATAAAAAPRPADIDGDGALDAADAQAFLDAVGKGSPPHLDLDGDGKTGLSDALLFGRWVDGLWDKPEAGLGSLYFQDPADADAFAHYEADAKAKSAWGPAQIQGAYPDPAKPFAPVAGPIEFETEVADAFAGASTNFDKAAFLSKVRNQGVAVASTSAFPNFFQALDRIHNADLPLLFTTDAMLHTIFLSYDNLLAELEESRFAGLLDAILGDAAAYAEAQYAQDASGQDVIELLNTGRLLLDRTRGDVERTTAINARLAAIDGLAFQPVSLWGIDTVVDFSQFKPRGHYTRSAKLKAYFQAMMWLSRADLAFDLRKDPKENKAAYTRMKRDAVILWDCLVGSGAYAAWLEIDHYIAYMVGTSDGLSPKGMGLVLHSLNVTDAKAFVAAFPEARFDSAIAAGKFGAQAILSQGKVFAPGDPLDLSPIFSFMPQRFILDSYTFSQMVHPVSPLIAWPSALQVAFALGDNGAVANLAGTGAAANGRLAAQRGIYDGISEAGWRSNLYTAWLGFLRKLNAGAGDKAAPVFRSPGWSLKMRNAQLASWAQLRHNTILYAKQSYTGGVTCEFPKAYVEPYPAFFGAVSAYAKAGGRLFQGNAKVTSYFAKLEETAAHLQAIAARSAQGLGPDASQAEWLRGALTSKSTPKGCTAVKVYDGWFMDLIYGGAREGIEGQDDRIVADVHTKPYDDDLGPSGVLFEGTGPIRLAAVAIQSDSCATLYAAPVLSFYEQKRLGSLERMTDDEWIKSFDTVKKPNPPDWMKPILIP